jgi:hypothetical protein
MDFALDPYTKLRVYPKAAKGHKSYLCPACSKPVTVRCVGSKKRVAHFAHRKNVANSDCENFFESDYSTNHRTPTLRPLPPIVPPVINRPKFKPEPSYNTAKNLYLVFEVGAWKLYLTFNLPPSYSRWGGQMRIQGKNGERQISYRSLGSKDRLEVDFNFDNTSVSKYGDVDAESWQLLTENMPKINSKFNFFHAPDGSGRMLEKAEALRLDEKYILAQRVPVDQLALFQSITSKEWIENGIFFYEFCVDSQINKDVRSYLTIFLEKEINESRQVFKLLDPLPLKIESDGVVRIDSAADNVLIEFSGDPNLLHYHILGGIFSAEDIKIDGSLIRVFFNQARGIEVYSKNSFLIRIEKTEERPSGIEGIKLIFGERKFDLLDDRLISKIRTGDSFAISSSQFPIDLIQVSKDSGKYSPDSNGKYIFDYGLEINAKSFGYFSLTHNYEHIIDLSLPTYNSATSKWLTSLMFNGSGKTKFAYTNALLINKGLLSGGGLPQFSIFHSRKLENKTGKR